MEILYGIIIAVILFLIWLIFKRPSWKVPTGEFPKHWRIILTENVDFYNHLTNEQKIQFEYELQEFLLNYRITGISTSLNDKDRILIAASGVIPIFAFPDWKYSKLKEILVYPSSFNEDYETVGSQRPIGGMIGTGYLSGIMILSKAAVYQGFANERDGSQTAIHEFVHMIDYEDGHVDGIPQVLMERQYVIPWMELARHEIQNIRQKKSSIRQYGGTNPEEFFAVLGEYFFEKPHLLQKQHPDIYKMLEKVFNLKLAKRNPRLRKYKLGRNSKCPCESGKKFKKCCGLIHY